MAKTYKTYLPDQDLLLPPSLRDWLPENHLAYCVSDVVDQLDLSAIESVYEKEDRGQPPYHPRMMTKILECSALHSRINAVSIEHLRGSEQFAVVLLERCLKASLITCLKAAMQRYQPANTSDRRNTSFTGQIADAYVCGM
jgi:hypothetical protein